jgi:transcriptional regulator PpsR
VKHFKAPREHLGSLSAETAASVIAAAGDIAVILDAQGVIRDVALQSDELSRDLAASKKWIGKSWSKVVTVESRPKVEALLKEANAQSSSRRRQVNHPLPGGSDLPVLYSVIQAGKAGSYVALGRDLRPMAVLQQQLVRAQESMERDYSRLRHIEMRYRLLFELSVEAVLIVDAGSLKVMEANPAARQLLGDTARRLVGQSVMQAFTDDSARSVASLLEAVRARSKPDNVEARLARPDRDVTVSASMFRQDAATLFLVRLATKGPTDATALPKLRSKMLKIIDNAPDGFVMTAPDGSILTANAAFLDMVNLDTDEQARGEPLERWIGRPGVDAAILISNLRERGSVRLFATTLNVDYGPTLDVEVSAVSVMNGGTPCFGFTVRNVAQRLSAEPRTGRQLPRSPEQLAELIGRMPLRDLVRETTDVIERLCIETALELTSNNRASAAELLGLSRQSLYVKLRRYGLADDSTDDAEHD